jgi:hypothetical protein
MLHSNPQRNAANRTTKHAQQGKPMRCILLIFHEFSGQLHRLRRSKIALFQTSALRNGIIALRSFTRNGIITLSSLLDWSYTSKHQIASPYPS